MKKYLLILALVSVVAFGAFAQTTATLNLTGTVGTIMSIDLVAEPVAGNLVLSVDQLTPLQVATITETSNVAYDVSVNSTNGYTFANGSDSMPYSLYYGGSVVSGNGVVNSGTFANGVVKTVSITYNAASGLDPGTYSDTLTFTISAQ